MKTRLPKLLKAALMAALLSSPSVYGDVATSTIDSDLTVDEACSVATLTIAETADASVDLDGATLTVTGNKIYLGYSNAGELTIVNGGSLKCSSNNSEMFLGYNANSSGKLDISGADSTLQVGYSLHVGYNGTGKLSISDGATVTANQTVNIGKGTGSQGSVLVTGNGSSLTSTKNCIYVGRSGSGALVIEDGASVSGTTIYLGYDSGVTGAVEISGEGSSLTSSYDVIVGHSGTGTLTVSDGATINCTHSITLGNNSTSSEGTMVVSGEGTSVTANAGMIVGANGIGHLIFSGGASASILNTQLCIADFKNAVGDVTVAGTGTNVTTANLHVGDAGKGTLEVSNGATMDVTGYMYLGYEGNGVGTVNVSGEGTDLTVEKRTYVGQHGQTGTITVSDGAYFGSGSFCSFNLDFSMTSDSTFETNLLFVASDGNTNMTIGGTNYLGDVVISTDESKTGVDRTGLNLTLLASGASVSQGAIALCYQWIQTTGTSLKSTDLYRSDEPMISWANVNVDFDVSQDCKDFLGNRIFLVKWLADDTYEYLDDGLIVAGQAVDVDPETYITFTKTVNGKTYTLDYVYDGISLTFANKVTITPEGSPVGDEDEGTVYSIEKTSRFITEDIVGDVDHEEHHDHTTYTPNLVTDEPITYVISQGINADESDFQIATTTFRREHTYTYRNAKDVVLYTEITKEDLGLHELTLYVNASDSTVSGGVLGLEESENEHHEGGHSMINNVLVTNGGTLTLTNGNIVNANHHMEADNGSITLDNATMNIGGGNFDNFRENEYIDELEIDFDPLADSTMENVTLQMSNGSTLNFIEDQDDEAATEVTISNSNIQLSEGSSINFTTEALASSESLSSAESLDTVDNDAVSAVRAVLSSSPMTVNVDQSTIDLSDTSSLNGGNGVVMSVKNSNILGVGKVSSFSSRNNTYTAGKNNVGVLELKNVASTNDTMETSIVGANALSGTHNTDTANVISQLKLSDGTTVSNGTFQLNVVGDSSLLTEGTSFQVLDLESALEDGFTTFEETGTALMDGYTWDYSDLNSEGIVRIAFTTLGDGTRIADTMLSAAQSVSYSGKIAMDHLYNYYAGKHNFHATGNNFWVSSLGTYQCVGNHKGRTGFTFRSLGYAVGYDRAFSDRVVEGIDLGQTWGKHYPKQGTARYSAGKIDQDAMVVTQYGLENLHRSADLRDEINLEHYVAFGKVRNKSVKMALATGKLATAKWDDQVWSAGISCIWDHQINEHWSVSPFSSIDYEHVAQNNFTERMGSITAHYKNGSYQNWEARVGAATNYNIKFKNNMELTPMASVAYVGSFARNVPTVSVSEGSSGTYVREKAVNPGRNAVEASAGVLWKVSDSTNVSAFYSFYAAHDTTEHNANVMVSYAF